MSYKIKSTPYFQPILKTTKLNGQLQMLKEKYERSSFFNDHNIEKRVRKIRLKRLFKEIEELNEVNSKKRKINPKVKPHTKESERLEILEKSKNLGQYYSECNFKNAITSDVGLNSTQKVLPQSKSKMVVIKRIKYGNEISDWNMQRIQFKKLRKVLLQGKQKTDFKSIIQKPEHNKTKKNIVIDEKLKRNVCNNNNGNQLNNNERSACLKDKFYPKVCNKCDINSSVINLSENVQLIDLDNIDENFFKSCNKLHETILIDNDNIKVILHCPPGEDIKIRRAIELWHKLSVLLISRIRKSREGKNVQTSNSTCEPTMEYKLRSISNGTSLLETDAIPSREEQFNRTLIENDEESNDERLINTEYLFKTNSSNTLNDELPRYPPPPPPLPPSISITSFSYKIYPKTITELPEDNYVDDIYDSMDLETKDNYNLKVKTMRTLFEHHNN